MRKKLLLALQMVVLIQTGLAQRDKVYTSLEEVTDPDSVYVLELKRAGLREFPMRILEFRNLEKLDLSRNKMVKLPVEIGRLKNLVYLNLNHNRLDSIPKEIGQLAKLETLILSRNRILELPEEMGELHNLRELRMLSNGIIAVPESFRKLDKTLKIFDLRANPQTYDQQEAIRAVLPSVEIKMTYVCNCQ